MQNGHVSSLSKLVLFLPRSSSVFFFFFLECDREAWKLGKEEDEEEALGAPFALFLSSSGSWESIKWSGETSAAAGWHVVDAQSGAQSSLRESAVHRAHTAESKLKRPEFACLLF